MWIHDYVGYGMMWIYFVKYEYLRYPLLSQETRVSNGEVSV